MTFDMSDLYGIIPYGRISHISYIPYTVYKSCLIDRRRREAPQKERYYDKNKREASGI